VKSAAADLTPGCQRKIQKTRCAALLGGELGNHVLRDIPSPRRGGERGKGGGEGGGGKERGPGSRTTRLVGIARDVTIAMVENDLGKKEGKEGEEGEDAVPIGILWVTWTACIPFPRRRGKKKKGEKRRGGGGGGKEKRCRIRARRSLAAAVSPAFATMMGGKGKEKGEGRKKVVREMFWAVLSPPLFHIYPATL